MKNINKIYLVLFALFLGLFFIFLYLFFSLEQPIEVSYIDVNFSVGDFIGLFHSPTGLDYGLLPPGMSSEKFIILSNKKNFDVEIIFFVEDSLNPFLFGEKKVILHSGEEMNYSMVLKVPEDLEFGNYSGKIRMEIYEE